MMVNVFEQTGYSLHRIEPTSCSASRRRRIARLHGGTAIAQGIIPPPNPPAGNAVTERIDDPETGLPSEKEFPNSPVPRDLGARRHRYTGVGIAFGGPEGTGAAGGVTRFQFGDELENNIVAASVQASGYLQDIGGQVRVSQQTHRWNYGVALSHIPYLQLGEFSYDSTIRQPGRVADTRAGASRGVPPHVLRIGAALRAVSLLRRPDASSWAAASRICTTELPPTSF